MIECLSEAFWVVGSIFGLFLLAAFAPTVVDMIIKWKNKPKKKSSLKAMGDDDCGILFNIKKQTFDDNWEKELSCAFLMNEQYGLDARWSTDQAKGMVFGPDNVEYLIGQLNNQFRDYCVRYTKVSVV